MFTTAERDRLQARVIDLARSDPRITGGALIGSRAARAGDVWSDVDLTFGVADEHALDAVLHDWTRVLDAEAGVLDHFDLRSGASIYRVLLLANGLEIDVSVSPESSFGPRRGSFQLLFGTARPDQEVTPPDARFLIGLGWHHILHARACIERARLWQAEYWISGIRDQTLALACLRLGEPVPYARGADRLPVDLTAPLAGALVRSLDAPELRRALAVAATCLVDEVARWDADLSARLTPVLREFAGS